MRVGLVSRTGSAAFDREAVPFVAIIAVTYALISPPAALNFLRLLPLLVPLLVLHIWATRRRGVDLRSLRVPVVLIPLLLWWLASTVWSVDPALTLAQSGAAALALGCGMIAGSVMPLRSLLQGVALGGLVVLAASVLVVLVAPGTGLEGGTYEPGAIRGIYVDRNVLAAALLPAAIAAVVLLLQARTVRSVAGHLLVTSILTVGVVMTRSSTALAAFVAAAVVALLAEVVLVAPSLARIPLLLIAAAVVYGGIQLVSDDPELIFTLLSRESTLTGRVVIWQGVLELVAREPVLGYGRGISWAPGSFVGQYMDSVVGFAVSSAHSGYLQLLLETGAAGLALFAAPLLWILVRSAWGLVTSYRIAGWGSAFLVVILVHNYTESSIVSMLTLYMVSATIVVNEQAARRSLSFVGRQRLTRTRH